jgi:uncharacterized damage-inducible protein DinB
MSKVAVWFERKFTFDFPADLYPNLIIRLRGTPARLEELVHGLAPERLTSKPEGKWSIQENAGHLLDLEPLWFARVDDFIAGKETLAAADLTNRKTNDARHNERRIEELLAAFRKARTALVGRLETLTAADFARTALHPRLKTPMRLADHLYFIAEHDDHHLARIWELRS